MSTAVRARLLRLILTALVLWAPGVGAAAQQPQDQAVPDSFKAFFEPAEPLRIVGPIHFVGTADLGIAQARL